MLSPKLCKPLSSKRCDSLFFRMRSQPGVCNATLGPRAVLGHLRTWAHAHKTQGRALCRPSGRLIHTEGTRGRPVLPPPSSPQRQAKRRDLCSIIRRAPLPLLAGGNRRHNLQARWPFHLQWSDRGPSKRKGSGETRARKTRIARPHPLLSRRGGGEGRLGAGPLPTSKRKPWL